MEALSSQLAPLDIPLSHIYLDPNNPRFVTMSWDSIPEDQFDNPEVQEESRRKLIRDFSVDKLRMNMEVNGYLPIDRVIVRQFKPDKYVVLEGNRRICAAKLLASLTAEGDDVDETILQTVSSIPCLLYTGDDPKAAWVFQGPVKGTHWSIFTGEAMIPPL